MKQKINAFKKLSFRLLGHYSVKINTLLIKPASVLARRVFEFKNIQRMLGVFVVVSAFSLANFPGSVSGLQTAIETNFSQVQLNVPEIKTEKSIRLPIDSFTITQGYNLLHPGLDLAAVKGAPVYPIMNGTVEKVDHDRFALGNHVIINHGSGYLSVYAHLSKIEVKEGEKVDKNSIVGLVGSTGWSTGPHLHFQVWQDNHWTNPRAFFEGYFGQRLASTRQ